MQPRVTRALPGPAWVAGERGTEPTCTGSGATVGLASLHYRAGTKHLDTERKVSHFDDRNGNQTFITQLLTKVSWVAWCAKITDDSLYLRMFRWVNDWLSYELLVVAGTVQRTNRNKGHDEYFSKELGHKQFVVK